MKKYIFLIYTLIVFTACGEDSDNETLVLPSNLEVSTTTEGMEVIFSAHADNANFYTFYFGENEATLPEAVSNDGAASYTFDAYGTYDVVIRAHASDDQYTEVTEQIILQEEVEEDDDEDPVEEPESDIPSLDGMQLVWSDEFDGSSLDESNWTFEIGNNNGWGNNELQYYREENTVVSDGVLTITAKKENYNGFNYTSSRLKTKDKYYFKYGRVDIKAQLPQGQGIWPALWMLGQNIDEKPWPACGEIDMMEMVGGEAVDNHGDNTVNSTLHWESSGQAANYGTYTRLQSGIFADDYHIFTTIWEEDKLTSYVDGVSYFVIDISPEDLSEFHEDFFLLINLAVGGNWPGSPDAETTFPQEFKVDYIRVYQPE